MRITWSETESSAGRNPWSLKSETMTLAGQVCDLLLKMDALVFLRSKGCLLWLIPQTGTSAGGPAHLMATTAACAARVGRQHIRVF